MVVSLRSLEGGLKVIFQSACLVYHEEDKQETMEKEECPRSAPNASSSRPCRALPSGCAESILVTMLEQSHEGIILLSQRQ